uniref:EF-hand domain-containing protein n=1 Tax=Amphora coffeiformis TaxID=265554 RepID=A0A7S3P7I4_9STRA
MYIWNAFAKLLECTRRGIQGAVSTVCGSSQRPRRRDSYPNVPDVNTLLQDTDERQQQHHRSLTSEYVDYGHSSRALHTCLFHTFTYYVVAVILFSFVVQDWNIVDSLYYATVLFTTIGYGDVVPTSDWSRVATMGLAFYGIIILGVFLGIYGGSLVDSHNQSIESHKKKINTDLVKNMESSSKATDADQKDQDDDEPSLFQDVLRVIVLETPIVSVVVLCGLVIGHFEGWGFIESLYWTVITGSTIGFGDDSPKVRGARIASIFFLPLAVGVVGEVLGRVAGVYLDRKQRMAEKTFLQQSLTLSDIKTMDANNDGSVDKAEFLSYMLVTLQRVEKEEIDSLLSLFDKLDVDNSGTLNREDLRHNLRNGLKIKGSTESSRRNTIP